MNKVSVKGVLVGAVVDVVSSGIVGIPLVLYVITHTGITDESALISEIHSRMRADLALHSIQLILGTGCSILGGYVAARIAKHDEVLNGALSSFLCILLGIHSAASGGVESPVEFAFLFPVTIGAAALGGFLARKSRRVAMSN
jgi:hypothetical protein